MGLIHFDAEVVLNSLYRHVLSQGAEHVINPYVVSFPVLPFCFKQLEGLLKDGLGTHLRWVRGTSEPIVVLLNDGVCALDGEVTGHLVEVHSQGFLLYKIISLAILSCVEQLRLNLSFQRLLLLKLFKPL